MRNTYVSISTCGQGYQAVNATGPWLNVGYTHCKDLLERDVAEPVGEVAQSLAACIAYRKLRDGEATRVQQSTGREAWQSIHKARANLAARGITPPDGAPAWL